MDRPFVIVCVRNETRGVGRPSAHARRGFFVIWFGLGLLRGFGFGFVAAEVV